MLGHTSGLERRYAGKDERLFVESHVGNHRHPFLKLFDIVNNLCLYEIGAGSNFLGKPYRTEFKGVGKGIFGSANKEFWLGGLQFLAGLKFLFVPKYFYHLDKLDGIYVKDAFCHRVIAEFLVISRKTQ